MFRSAERTLASIEKLKARPASFRPPAALDKTVIVSRRAGTAWPIFDVSPRDNEPTRRVLLLHGGCYVFEIDPLHWRFAARLAVESNARVTVLIMPLAPLGTASQIVPAVADLAAALVDDVGAANVTIFGDSSGGGMALAVAMVLRNRGVPPLGLIALSSPWLDISGTDPRLAEIDPHDPWLAVPGTHAAGALYRGELSEDDPLVSPIHGSLSGLGRVVMFSGTRDILNADAKRFLRRAESAGLDLDYHEAPGMIHNYPILPMPEGDAARKVIVEAMLR